jgi:hypothetical protein
MTEERWQTLMQKIKNDFSVLDQGEEMTDVVGELINFIEWEMSGRQMRAEYHSKPKVIDKKTFYSNRIGSNVKEEYVFSADEKVSFAKFFQRNSASDDWQEISAAGFV